MSKTKKNKRIRKELERLYGEGCFFNRARVAERIEEMGGIRTFKSFVKEKRYTGKPISHQLTLHHLQHRSENGATTVENGANVEEIAHQYIHSLPREQEEVINNMLREFKLNCVVMTGDGKVQESTSITIGGSDDFLVIPVYDNNERYNPEKAKEQQRKKKSAEDKKNEKYNRQKNPTRAMKKRELQHRIWEDEDDLEL